MHSFRQAPRRICIHCARPKRGIELNKPTNDLDRRSTSLSWRLCSRAGLFEQMDFKSKGGRVSFNLKCGQGLFCYEIIWCGCQVLVEFLFAQKSQGRENREKKTIPFLFKTEASLDGERLWRHSVASSLKVHGECSVFEACGSLSNCLDIWMGLLNA